MASKAVRAKPRVFPKNPTKRQIEKVLRETFGLQELRDAQADVIKSVLAGQHTLAVMPTGAGKSLCYQLPGQLLEGTTVVVSPLISLMKDQKEKLEDLDIEAVELNSTLTQGDQRDSLEQVRRGNTEFVYVTPERLANPEFQDAIKKMQIDLLVIDEAHCMSQWGHDFRPAYLAIPEAWKQLGKPQILALTATATGDVIEEIRNQFGLKHLETIHSGVLRDNLRYEATHVEKEEDKLTLLLEILAETKGSGIIYSATVSAVEQIHHALTEVGIDAVKYHGKMPIKERNQNQDLFMSGKVPIVVATNAFGMGIDKQDIRFVIHYHFAGSLEAYYQESGRAGRDGKLARCLLLYLKKDKSTQSFFLAGKYPQPDAVFAVYQALNAGESVTTKELQDAFTSIPVSKIKVIVSALRSAEIIDMKARGKIAVVKKNLERKNLEGVFTEYRNKKAKDQEKLKQMIIYAQSAMCRWKILLKYFEQDVDWETCGHCDNCLSRDQKQITRETTIPVEPKTFTLQTTA